ncbi:three-helix bundle dimerization domain-containing protein [Nocardia sp. NPDC046763]|uniref:three-helix bundle dimerization domain-containing protein n=1 Tax=Nocardia sp. NPDC046763 TaxID=3155256 RepID=UPI0033C84F5C
MKIERVVAARGRGRLTQRSAMTGCRPHAGVGPTGFVRIGSGPFLAVAEEISGHTDRSGSTSVDCHVNDGQPWFMPSSDEVRRLAELTDRLAHRFPAISVWTIATIVHEVHQGFDGRPVAAVYAEVDCA